jgi:hypothetical protein
MPKPSPLSPCFRAFVYGVLTFLLVSFFVSDIQTAGYQAQGLQRAPDALDSRARGNDDRAGKAQTNPSAPVQVSPRGLSEAQADLQQGTLTVWVPRSFVRGVSSLPASDRYHDYSWKALETEFKADFPNFDLRFVEMDRDDFIRAMHRPLQEAGFPDVAFADNYGEVGPLLKENAVVRMWERSRFQYPGWWVVFRQARNFAAGESFLLWASQRFHWTPWSVSTKAIDAADVTAVQELSQRAIQAYAKADGQALDSIMDPDAARFEFSRRDSVQAVLSVEPLVTFGNSHLAFTLLAAVEEGDQTFGMAHLGLVLRNKGAGWKVWHIIPDSSLPELEQMFQSFDRLGLAETGAQAVPKVKLLAPADRAQLSRIPPPQIEWSTVDAPLATYVVESQFSNPGVVPHWGPSWVELVSPISIGPSISMPAPFGGSVQPFRWRVWAIGKNGVVSTSDWRLIDFTRVPALAEKASAPAEASAVTVEPACMEWVMPAERGQPMIAPHITIRYNPQAPAARLGSAQSLTLVIATQKGVGFDSIEVPMTRTGSPWQADYVPQRDYIPGYAIFFFKDGKNSTDNHGGQYWDILNCDRGEPSPFAVAAQASTYEGRLLAPGIQRAPDLPRALAILKADVDSYPSHYSRDDYWIWTYELKLGSESAAAYEQVGRELDAFITDHSTSFHAMIELASFIAPHQRELPSGVVQRFRQAVSALPEPSEVSQINSQLDYWLLQSQADERKRAQGYLAFAAKYPQSPYTNSAYQKAFNCELEMKDVAGAESVFEKQVASDRESAEPLLAMAQFYLDQKTKADRAVELLGAAQATLTAHQAHYSPDLFVRERGRTEFLRGQAYLLLGDLPHARAHLEAADQVTPDDPKVLYALGEVREKMGDKAQALEAYFTAACAPYEESSGPREAYERLFVALKLGTTQDAEQKILERISRNSNRVAAQYTPIPFNRPAPKFSFTDLDGKPFDNQAAKGKPALLTFWSPG